MMAPESSSPVWQNAVPRHEGGGGEPQEPGPSDAHPGFKLDAIAVFQDREKQENIRSVQIYSQGGQYMALQQGFSLLPTGYFSLHEPFGIYFSSEAESLRFMARQKADRDWACILDYADYLPAPASINPLLSPKSNPLLSMLPTIVNDLSYVETVIELAKMGGGPSAAACSGTAFATAGFGRNWGRPADCRSFEELILRSPSPVGEMESLPDALRGYARPLHSSLTPPRSDLSPVFPKIAPTAPRVASNGFTTAHTFANIPLRPAPLTNFAPTSSPSTRAPGSNPSVAVATPPELLLQSSFSGPPRNRHASPMGTVFLNIRQPKPLSPQFGGPVAAPPTSEPSTSSATTAHKASSTEGPQSALSGVTPTQTWVSPSVSPSRVQPPPEETSRKMVNLAEAEKGTVADPQSDTWQQQEAQKEDVNPIRGAGHRVMLEVKTTPLGQHNMEGTFLSIYRSLQGGDLVSPREICLPETPSEPLERQSSDSGEKSWPGEPTISSLLPACTDAVFLELEDLPGDNNCPEISNRAEKTVCTDRPDGDSSASSQDMDFESGSSEPESSPLPTKGPVLGGSKPAKSRFRPPDGFRAPLKRAGKLTVEDLTPFFDMPMSEACKALGIGSTVLKRRCRDLNIPRWPYRKVKSIEGLIRAIHELGPRDGSSNKQVKETLQRLEGEKKRISESPGLSMGQETKKFRQACFNASHKAKKSAKPSSGGQC